MKGIAASPGIAIGKAFIILRDINTERYPIKDFDTEAARLENAVNISKGQINELILEVKNGMGSDAVEIFTAHRLILEDEEFISEIKAVLSGEGVNAESAVLAVAKMYKEIFNNMADKYLKQRAEDISDVVNRLICNLSGSVYDMNLIPENSVVIAKNLAPSDIVALDKARVIAIAAEEGSSTSHTAILARIMGIPAVMGLQAAISQVNNGDTVIVDGNFGEVIIKPEDSLLVHYRQKAKDYMHHKKGLKQLINLPCITLDGKAVKIEANIVSLQDVDEVLKYQAEGIGLFRTEFLFMDGNVLPNEEEQYEAYTKVVRAMNGRKVTIRTLDIGGDKDISSSGLKNELSNFKNYRGIRLCFEKREMFKTQLRAILRAAKFGKVSIMYPMISSLQEVLKANSILAEAKTELLEKEIPFSDDIEVGIMIEIPSAAIMADILARHVDFFSIGTNDLTQYTLAVDRGSCTVQDYYDYFNPAVLRLIKNCIDQSHKYGKYTAMCGEMASDPQAVKVLLGLGLDVFSMNAGSILEIKDIIRGTSLEEARKFAETALQFDE